MSLMIVREMAETLQVTDSYIARLCRQGKIKGAFKVGSEWRVAEPDWITYLKSIGYPVDKMDN